MLIVEDFNTMLEEAGGHTPAIVTFKRGTVIRCDHIRLFKPKRIIFMGIGPSISREKRNRNARNFRGRIGYTKFPDFMTVQYIDSPEGPPYEGYPHNYDSKKIPLVTWKFDNILTANLDNIASIKKI